MKENTILITGSTSGVGEYLARKLATQNNTLILTGRDEQKLKDLADELGARCKKVITVSVDFSDTVAVDSFANHYIKDVTIIINSAADFGAVKNIVNVTNEQIISVFSVNVLAPITIAKSAIAGMIERGYGRIINIGSTGGLGGYPLRLPYCLSKNALIAFTKTLNGELRSGEFGDASNVKAFCVCPGPIKGDRLEKQISSRAEYKNIPSETMRKKFDNILGRVLDLEEVADAIIGLFESDPNHETDIITF